MQRIRLIHWNAAEAEERGAKLRSTGYEVTAGPLSGPDELRRLRDRPPTAFVIDLTRLPSQGRDLGVMLRRTAATRNVPILFVGGEPGKVKSIRRLLPDAVYTDWNRIRAALKRALSQPVSQPVVPDSNFAAYSDKALTTKLGVKPNSTVVLVNAPPDFEITLGELPAGVTLHRDHDGRRDLTIWFVDSPTDLEHQIPDMTEVAANGGLWVVWAKQGSAQNGGLTQTSVRRIALPKGLVDFKVSAIDETWTGLRFTQRQ